MPEPGEETTTTTAAAHDKPHENNPPNPTLYVRNLCERVGVEELKKSLWQMFNQYGVIVDIYCRPKALKCKGQAWICFKTEESAQEAMSEMQGYSFYDKNIDLSFARVKSDVISKEDGSFTARKKAKKKRRFEGDAPEGREKRVRTAAAAAGLGTPSKILFVENCPEDRPDVAELLNGAFTHFPGFLEVRVVPGNASVAFVEFSEETTAMRALVGLQDHAVAGRNLRISFPKK